MSREEWARSGQGKKAENGRCGLEIETERSERRPSDRHAKSRTQWPRQTERRGDAAPSARRAARQRCGHKTERDSPTSSKASPAAEQLRAPDKPSRRKPLGRRRMTGQPRKRAADSDNQRPTPARSREVANERGEGASHFRSHRPMTKHTKKAPSSDGAFAKGKAGDARKRRRADGGAVTPLRRSRPPLAADRAGRSRRAARARPPRR